MKMSSTTNAVPVLRPAELQRDNVPVLEPGAGAGAIGLAPVAVGQAVKYMSLGGGVYDAVVLATRPNGRIDIETSLGVFLTRIVLAKGVASVERGEAFVP